MSFARPSPPFPAPWACFPVGSSARCRFQKFAQADASDSRQKSGTGLGLAITRELIGRMGGRIGFDSVENKGASFFFDLPIQSENADTAAAL